MLSTATPMLSTATPMLSTATLQRCSVPVAGKEFMTQ
jgi:hypothetical protein